jgi:hypothetical protein
MSVPTSRIAFILRQISPEILAVQLEAEQKRIDGEFSLRLAQIKRQDRAQWNGFARRLLILGVELIQEGLRLM